MHFFLLFFSVKSWFLSKVEGHSVEYICQGPTAMKPHLNTQVPVVIVVLVVVVVVVVVLVVVVVVVVVEMSKHTVLISFYHICLCWLMLDKN